MKLNASSPFSLPPSLLSWPSVYPPLQVGLCGGPVRAIRGLCRLALSYVNAERPRALLLALVVVSPPLRRRASGLGEKGGAVCDNRPCSGLLALLGLLLRRLLCLLRHCSLLMGG